MTNASCAACKLSFASTAPENSEGNYHTAYTGKALKPAILVYDGRTLLKEKTDYTVSYKDNTNAGSATVTVKGKGNYSDSITATFDIDAIHIATLDIADMYAAVASNNTKQVPLKPVVKFNGKTLKVKKDYTAAYKDPDGGKTPGTPSKDYEVLISAVSDVTVQTGLRIYCEVREKTYHSQAKIHHRR